MLATEDLRTEHEAILLMLKVLGEMASRAASGKAVDLDDASRMIDFFEVFADKCHHGKEEGLLFPALEEAGIPRQDGPVGVMLHEHDQGRRFIQEMALAVNAGKGFPEFVQAEPDLAQFAQAARNYIELLESHIRKENEVLFTMADQVLSPQMQKELKAAFDTFEREHMGAGVHGAFHVMIGEMARKYLG